MLPEYMTNLKHLQYSVKYLFLKLVLFENVSLNLQDERK